MSVDIFVDQTPTISRRRRSQFSWSSFGLGVLVAGIVCTFVFPEKEGSKPEPITDKGLRVLIVEETEKRGDLSSLQRQSLLSTDVRNWLEENCIKDDGHPARLLIDSETDVSQYGPKWSRLREAATPPFPCVVVSDPPRLERMNIDAQTGPQKLIQLIKDARGE